MTDLRICLLGSPRIELDGAPLDVDTRKAVALLAYLAVGGRVHARDHLAALLWSESDPKRARASLRRTLSALLKGLQGRWVVATRSTVRLEPEGVWCDVDHLQTLLAEARGTDDLEARLARLSEAAALYRDDFLSDFVLRDSPEFDDWQFFTAETLRRDLAGALEHLTDGCAQLGDVAGATAHARRWLALDPLHEPAHRRLMLLYAWSGRRQAALRQFRECVRTLRRELGVAPLPETVELYQAIRAGRVPDPPALGCSPPPSAATRQVGEVATVPASGHEGGSGGSGRSPGRWALPLIGRDDELAALRRLCAAPGHVAVVEGEPGIGKTRLVEESTTAAAGAGAAVVSVRCYEGEEQLAYSAIVELVRAVLARGDDARLRAVPGQWWAEAARLLPELADRAPGGAVADPNAPGAPIRLLEALAGLVTACLAGTPPGVLCLDDAHWLDPAGLDLVGYLVRRAPDLGLVILLAWRTELVAGNHPLRALLRCAGAGSASHWVLDRLDADQVNQLVDVAAPATPVATRQRLVSETEGVPLFVVEYLSALATGNESDWAGGGVAALLAERIAGVRGAARQVLTTAAVIGRSFDLDTLRVASGRSEAETVTGLEELLAAGLIQERLSDPRTGATSAPIFDFAHHKLRQKALAETSLVRRRLLHRRVADALGERARGGPETAALGATIAAHLAAAGDEPAAAIAYARAGDAAATVHAISEALTSYEAALALGHPEPARLHEASGDLHRAEGAYGTALICYETAAALAEPADVVAIEHKMAGVRQMLAGWDLDDGGARSAELQPQVGTLTDW